MLKSLHIENIAVISCADVDFENGFSVLTGETGAGKSIIIDSINMLMGNKASKDIVRKGKDRAVVSGVFENINDASVNAITEMGFDVSDNSIMLQRILTKDGKSTIKLNGQTITQAIQREVARLLINIHGQNDNQRLLHKNYHLSILDSYANCNELLLEYKKIYIQLNESINALKVINFGEAERLRRIEMLKFQIADISTIKLKPGAEEKLEQEKKKLLNLEKVNKQVKFAYRILYGNEKGASAYYILDRASAALSSVSDAFPELAQISARLSEMKYDIEDMATSVNDLSDDSCVNPTERINQIEAELDAVSKLKRKYGATVKDVIEYKIRAEAELDDLENCGNKTEALESEIDFNRKQATALAEKLHNIRAEAAQILERGITDTLEFLDMSKVRFKVSVKQTPDLGSDGFDDVEFLIAVNKGDIPMPMIRIASGGELSRIMLAVKSVLADKDNVDTLIYDEVDAGISGKTSQKVGIKLKQTAKNVQVICVTHSAQIASLSDMHYLVSKTDTDNETHTSLKLLDNTGRIDEVARILGGINITEAQRNAAAEMISEGKKY